MVDVSIVLIGYNDSQRLPRALASLQAQSLHSIEIIAVDDCSTDNSLEILRQAAKGDPRIRVEQLAVNSGGCSAPRNRGIELAQGTYIMFCDSDDEFDRHACRNLFHAAEKMHADVVVGAAERIVTDADGRVETKIWWPDLHSEVQTVGSLADLPELLYDTISVNKIYRRELLIQRNIDFPQGLLFEDQLFTLNVYLAAARIGVIPEVVYRWYVDRSAASITQSRKELRNLKDRIEINRRMDLLLVHLPEIAFHKNVKFLKHEASLYLTTIFESDEESANSLEQELAAYCQTIPAQTYEHVRPGLRVALYYLLVGDHVNLKSALRFDKGGGVIDVVLAGSAGTQWSPEHGEILGRSAKWWLNVTDLHIPLIPFARRKYRHVLESDGSVKTTDFLGDLGDSPQAQLVLAEHKTGAIITAPMSVVNRSEGRLTWQVDWSNPELLQNRGLNSGEKGGVFVELTRGSEINRCDIEVPEKLPIASMNISAVASFSCADRIEFERSPRGSMLWQAHGSSRSPSSLMRKVRRTGTGVPATRPQAFTVPTGRPIFIFAPQRITAFSTRMERFDTEAWIRDFGVSAYLLIPQEPFTPAPGRARYAYQTYSESRRNQSLSAADWVITDDPELLTLHNAIAFQRDLGAARYLLAPIDQDAIVTSAGLHARVSELLEGHES